MAAANSAYGGGSPGISVLLGKGDGSFSPAVNYGAGIGPSSVVVGDFNGDSKPDLVVANDSSPGSVSVLLGKGDGSFQPPVSYGVGPSPRSVAAGDFNGDGRPDLAVANLALGLYSPSVSVLLGKGDGTFEPAVKYAVGFDPRFVAVSDFNGDGKPDLAVIYNNNVTVLLNTGASAGLRLGVARTNMGLTLSWPLPHADFVLESTTSVGSTNWQGAIEAPMTNNGRLEVTAPLTQQQGYFRLRKP